jgi:transglutaminase-like putative cysteine protease
METVPDAVPPDRARVACTLQIKVVPAPGTRRVAVTAALPRSVPGRQRVLGVTVSPEAEAKRWRAPNGGDYVRFDLDRPDRPRYLQIDVEAELVRADFETARRAAKPPAPPRDLARYLAPEPLLQSGDVRIRRVAAGIRGEGAEGVRAVVRWVAGYLHNSGYNPVDLGAVGALSAKKGDCSEATDLAVALCRAKRIPARVWNGYLMLPVAAGDTQKHAWMEAWLPGLGWVPFDPFHYARRMAGIDRLRPVYLYVSDVRRDSLLDNYHYWSYNYWGDPPRLTERFVVRRAAA